eukprot:353071_1
MSSFDKTMQQFEQMKLNLAKNAPSKEDKIPIGAEYRFKLLMRHKLVVNHNTKAEKNGMVSLQTNSDAVSCEHLCRKHENELKNALISNLVVNQINFGKKLNVTVVSECVQVVGIQLIVQDSQQNVLVLSLYNLVPLRTTVKELSLILPIGTKLIIKEPYVKKSASGDIAIRIDNIHTNLIIIHPNDPKYITIKETNTLKLKKIGNDYFKKKMYSFAVRYYSESLNSIQSNNKQTKVKLLTNRSLCYLKMNKFSEAVNDAQTALELDKNSIKIRYRLATALMGIRKHQQALDTIKSIVIKNIESISIQKDFESLRARIHQRLLQSKQFNALCFKQQIKSITWEQMQDIQDYFSLSIKIKYINNVKGRGMVATKDICKNEVILSEKCLTFGHINKEKLATLMDHGLNEIFFPSRMNLIQNIVDIYKNGKDIDKYKISLLYKGGKYKKKDVCVPKMELFKVDILPKNVKQIPILNIQQIREIATKNTFTMPTDKESQKEFMSLANKSYDERKVITMWFTGSALFVVASFFNHDNNPNVDWNVNGKRIHLTADRDIKKGEELCIRYHEDGADNWIDKK